MLYSICVLLEIRSVLSSMQAFWYKLNLYLTDSEFSKRLETTATVFSKNLKEPSTLTLALSDCLFKAIFYYPNFRFTKSTVAKCDLLPTSNCSASPEERAGKQHLPGLLLEVRTGV